MTGLEIFAICFLALMTGVIPFGIAWECGMRDEISKRVVEFMYKKIGRQ